MIFHNSIFTSLKLKNFQNTQKSKNDQPIALDRAHLSSRLHRSRGQSSVLESWISLGSPQLPGPSFPAYESPPTANRQVHWWVFTTLQNGSRRILPPFGWGINTICNQSIFVEVYQNIPPYSLNFLKLKVLDF